MCEQTDHVTRFRRSVDTSDLAGQSRTLFFTSLWHLVKSVFRSAVKTHSKIALQNRTRKRTSMLKKGELIGRTRFYPSRHIFEAPFHFQRPDQQLVTSLA
jgi:hypothetical protein